MDFVDEKSELSSDDVKRLNQLMRAKKSMISVLESALRHAKCVAIDELQVDLQKTSKYMEEMITGYEPLVRKGD